MDLDRAREIVREQAHAVLGTMRRDGTPQLSPVAVAVHPDGRLLVSTRAKAYKVRNLRRDPRAWLCVLPDAFFGRWIQIEGSVEIVEQPAALELLVEYYRLLSGEHPDWGDYREAMRREERVILRISPTRAGPDRSG